MVARLLDRSGVYFGPADKTRHIPADADIDRPVEIRQGGRRNR
jgi:hypothetical protein